MPAWKWSQLTTDDLFFVLAFFVHVLDTRFVDDEIGSAVAVHLDAISVVPFDDTMELLAVAHDDDHGRLTLHLFLVVEIFGIGAFRRRNLLAASGPVGAFIIVAIATFHGGWSVIMVVLGAAQRRPYQTTIRK